MDIDSLQRRFVIWKYILFINIGASVVLFIQSVLHYIEAHNLLFQFSWYGAWFMVQLATLFPGFVLLWGKHWMQIPLYERINTIFGYFGIAWFTFLPVGFRFGSDEFKSYNLLLLSMGVAIVICYGWLRRKSIDKQNEIFP